MPQHRRECQRPAITLTFDLQLFEYSLCVSSRLLKPFMKYRGNKICRDERTKNEHSRWTCKNTMPPPTLRG